MDKAKAIKLAGSAKKLADALGISTQAVYAWPAKVPPLQVYRLRDLYPKWFRK